MKRIYTLLLPIFMGTVAIAQPVITQNPQPTTICTDTCAVFEVDAVGMNLSFNWFATDGDSAYSVGTGSQLNLCDSVAAFDGYDFYAVVTDQNGDSATSDSALLTIDDCVPPVADFSFEWLGMEICFDDMSQNAETVIWLFGDGETDASNDQSPCHTYDTRELYFVKQVAFNDHGEDEITKPIDLLGTEEQIESSFDLFPNPTRDKLMLTSADRFERVSIRDASGRLVQTHYPSNATEVTVSVASLPTGVYSLEVVTDQAVMNRKFIKQ